MNYCDLAKQLLENMQVMHKIRPSKKLSDSMCGEIFILRYLRINGDNVLPSCISTEMKISSARVAAALNNLEKKDFISRQIDSSDRRRILVSLTKEGEMFEASIHESIISDTEKLLEALGEYDAKEYVRITGRIAAYYNKD